MKNIEKYLEWKRSYTRTASTGYRPALKLFLNRFETIAKVNDTNVITFFNEISLKYSPTYTNYIKSIVRDYLGFHSDKHEVNLKRIRMARTDEPHRTVMSKEDYDKILNSLNETNSTQLRDIVMYRLLHDTGIRVSELTAINLSDLNNQEKMILIHTKKAFKTRYVYWSNETHKYITSYIAYRIINYHLDDDPLFVSNHGKRLSVRQVQRRLANTCKKLGITQYNPHSFRHYKAHRIIEEGGDVLDVSYTLGHSEKSPLASFMYLRLHKDEQKRRAKKFI